MHPQIAIAAAAPPSPPSAPPTTLEAHILQMLAIRERALRIVRLADREVFAGIAQLDLDDGDPDLEPSHGEHRGVVDGEPDSDDEFSLGAPENHPSIVRSRRRHFRVGDGDQTEWLHSESCSHFADLELVNEDGDPLDQGEEVNEDGDPLDKGEGDNVDWEYTLGWSDNVDQRSLNATDDREPCGAGENVSQLAWARDTEVAAVVVGADGGETVIRSIGDPLKGLRTIHNAMEAGAQVRQVLFKRCRGDNIVPMGNLRVPGEWVRH